MRHLLLLSPYLKRHRRRIGLGLLSLCLTTALSAASPWILRLAIDDLVRRVTHSKLWLYAGLLLVLVVLEGICRYGMRSILIGMSREIEYELRNDFFRHLTRLPPAFYHNHRIGDLMSRATSDVAAVRNVLGPGIMYTANTVATFLATTTLMVTISPLLTALAFVPLVLVAVIVRHLGRAIHDSSEAVQAQLADVTALVQENLSGARVVRAYVQEAAEGERFAETNREYMRLSQRLILLSGGIFPAVQLLTGLGVVLVLWQGGALVITGRLTLGALVAFSAYLAMLNWPTIAIGWVINIFERGEASMGRLHAILAAPAGDAAERPRAATTVAGAVSFRGLTFSYNGWPVLKDIDLEVPSGSTIAIVGPTGSGKSTLVSLIARLYDAPPGTLFIDGHDIRALPLAALRAAVGFVPQESFLFSDTIAANIAFGEPDAGSEKVQELAQLAQIARDVTDFPRGYDTLVGERGITLSGGQKQRVAIARALLADPRIVILDDALSAVDTLTEGEILRGLRTELRGRTTFLVSHRISTVQDADWIVVLRDGRIVEQGTHADLVALGGFYADLHERQLIEDEMQREGA